MRLVANWYIRLLYLLTLKCVAVCAALHSGDVISSRYRAAFDKTGTGNILIQKRLYITTISAVSGMNESQASGGSREVMMRVYPLHRHAANYLSPRKILPVTNKLLQPEAIFDSKCMERSASPPHVEAYGSPDRLAGFTGAAGKDRQEGLAVASIAQDVV